MYEAGNGHGIRFHKVEPMFGEWALWNQCLVSGLPTDSSLLCFGTVKNSPSLYELDQKRPCVMCMKLFEVNGLSCVEINRLMHELNVLT